MLVFRCPSCQSPFTEEEWNGLEHCGTCRHLLRAPSNLEPTRVNETGPVSRPTRGYVSGFLGGLLAVIAFAFLFPFVSTRPVSPEQPIDAEQLDRLEVRLKAMDSQIHALQSAQSASRKELEGRLDQLDRKMAELATKSAQPVTLLQSQTEQLTRLESRLEALSQRAFAPPAPPGPLDIRVITKEWGDAEPDNVEAVCVSAAKELWAYFPNRRIEPITVNNSTKGPMALYGRGPDGERRILINIEGKLWARCAYQFSHEFCHVLCNHREAKNPNLWFEESLCEAASLFALRRMARTWKTKPPYPNWKSYSDALDDYANVTARTVAPMENLSFAEWFAKNETVLRNDGTDRPRNRVVALAILKLLEKDPHHWQAVGYLNQWEANAADRSFSSYLSDWFRRVPDIHKPFVKDVAELFKIEVK